MTSLRDYLAEARHQVCAQIVEAGPSIQSAVSALGTAMKLKPDLKAR